MGDNIPVDERITLGIAPNPVVGGKIAIGTLTYQGLQTIGVAVLLSSSNSNVARVPLVVAINLVQGNSADFPVQTTPVGPDTPVTISAKLVGNPNATADDTLLVTNNRP